MKRTLICCAVLAAAIGVADAHPAFNRPVPGHVANPALFVNPSQITNPYLPMPPGTTFIYDGHKGKRAEHDVIKVSTHTKTIIGIDCTIEVDTVYLNDVIVELTDDYFAQDKFGNVWYFGEFATQYKNGSPKSHAGSWQAGVNGAQPGVIMENIPHVGDRYNQENAAPIAEDKAEVLSVSASVQTPYGTYIGNVLETREFSPLDPPGSGEHKWYEPGVGWMKSQDIHGGPKQEVLELTAIR